MSANKTPNMEALHDSAMKEVSGGVTPSLLAANAVLNGQYGNTPMDQERNLRAAGYDPNLVLGLVQGLKKGYDSVARDVMNQRYGMADLRGRYSEQDIALIQSMYNNLYG